MSGFDIESLLEFHPARNWCMNCLALWEYYDESQRKERGYNAFIVSEYEEIVTCKICSVNYVIPKDCHPPYIINAISRSELSLPLGGIEDIFDHAKKLASICKRVREQSKYYPPLRTLFDALVEARSFVHFISWGITPLMIGALKVAAQRVSIRGIVSGNIGENIICEVNDFKYDAPRLNIKFCESSGYRTVDIPHQKLVVIDGLLAFKGSANLTQMAWRSAEKNMDIVEVVSNVGEIIRLHNQFFFTCLGEDKGGRVSDASTGKAALAPF